MVVGGVDGTYPDTASDNFTGGAIVDVGGVDGTHPDTASDNFAASTIVVVGGVDGTHPDPVSGFQAGDAVVDVGGVDIHIGIVVVFRRSHRKEHWRHKSKQCSIL